MAVLTTGHTFVDGQQVTSDRLNNIANAATFASAAVDGTTTQLSSGAIIVKDLGISAGKIAASAVTTAKLATDSVSTAKIIDSNVTKAKIENFTNLTVLGNVSGSAATPAEVTILDEDDMVSDSDTSLATQQSIKAYADSKVDGTGAGAFTTLTASDDVNFDSGTLFVDASANSVGIGTSSPDHKLSVYGDSDGNRTEIGIDNIDQRLVIGAYFESGVGQYSTIQSTNNAESSGTNLALQPDGGNVGIGTTSPAAKLSISDGNIGIDGNNSPQQFYGAGGNVAGTNTSGGVLTVIGHSPNATGDLSAPPYNGSNFVGASGIMARGFSESGQYRGSLEFFTKTASEANATSRMLISHDGNVGIGTASPQTNLDVSGSASSDIGLQIRAGDAGGQDSTQIAFSYNGSPYNSSGFAHNIRTQHSGSGEADNKISFYLWDFGTDTSSTLGSKHVMSLCGNGNVGIGDASPSYKLDVNGTFRTTDDIYNNISGTQSDLPGYYKGTYGAQIESAGTGSTLHIARSTGNCMNIGANSNATVVYFRDTSAGTTVATEVGSISITSSATAFNTSSDYRLKENEVSITDGIDRLKQLSPYRFNFKVDPDKIVDGFFAHEVSDVVPEAIRGEKDGIKDEEYEVSPAVYEDVVHPAVEAVYDEDGNELTPAVEEWTESVLVTEAVRDTRSVPDYQGIDQSKIVPLLTAALQEAVAKIEALEARVATLEG